jgi:hypothetical protein
VIIVSYFARFLCGWRNIKWHRLAIPQMKFFGSGPWVQILKRCRTGGISQGKGAIGALIVLILEISNDLCHLFINFHGVDLLIMSDWLRDRLGIKIPTILNRPVLFDVSILGVVLGWRLRGGFPLNAHRFKSQSFIHFKIQVIWRVQSRDTGYFCTTSRSRLVHSLVWDVFYWAHDPVWFRRLAPLWLPLYTCLRRRSTWITVHISQLLPSHTKISCTNHLCGSRT